MKRALVLSLIWVFGMTLVGIAATLSGSWDTDISIDPQEVDFNDAIGLHSEIIIVYTVGDWAFTSDAGLNSDEWVDQYFSVAGVLGALAIASDLEFDPNVPAFVDWGVDMSVSIASVSFDLAFDLEDEDVQLVLGASSVAGDVWVGVEVTFGGDDNNVCNLDWAGVEISLGFPFCCADIVAVIAFECSGFDSVTFETGGIAIPNLPWLTIDTELVFVVDEKYLELSPSIDFGDTACLDLKISAEHAGGDMQALSISSFVISGISLTCDIGAVTFTGVSDFNGGLGPNNAYWEYYTIETKDDACCGPVGFDLTFYFLEGGAKLFDVALIDVNMSLQIASQFTFHMGLEIDVESGSFTAWTLGFEVTW